MSIEELRKPEFRNQLLRASQLALDFHDQLSVRVSREEAEAVAVSLDNTWVISGFPNSYQKFMREKVLGSKWELHIVGS
jgi:hypothetical protein